VIDVAAKLRNEHGSLERIVTAQETLLEAVALANEALGLPGLRVAAVRRTLDKSQFKATLERAGLNTPRFQIVTSLNAARAFGREIGFPIVLKSVAGSGALATFLIDSESDLDKVIDLGPFLAEQFITGQELCIDTITIDSEPLFHSICCYQPSILAAIENPATQWSCVMPRDMQPYQSFIDDGLAAIRALHIGYAMTHMEGFIDANGRPCFTDATLRPAGARIAPMLAHAYDVDPYRVWARVAVDGCFDGPWERKYAVGTIFLRGMGAGAIENVLGIEHVQNEFGALLRETRWPRTGATKSSTYTGDGFVTIRHPDTAIVQDALHKIAQLVHIAYSDERQPTTDNWEVRLKNFHELNRPAWDQAN
jgi:carbamoyl-phosphate synthase L subunit-like protein